MVSVTIKTYLRLKALTLGLVVPTVEMNLIGQQIIFVWKLGLTPRLSEEH
jgi:hypothetical protein